MWTFKSPYYFSRFIVDIGENELNMDELIKIVSRSFGRFFVVKSSQVINNRIEVVLGNALWYLIQGSILPSVRKLIPLLCEISCISINDISTEIVVKVKPRNSRLNWINTSAGNVYVTTASHEVECSIKEFLGVFVGDCE